MQSGCIWSRAKINDTSIIHRQDQIIVGKTKIEQVPIILGAAPSSISEFKNGTTLYSFVVGDSRTNGLMLVLVNFTKTNLSTSAIYVIADAQGVVSQIRKSPMPDPEWEFWPFGD